MPGNAADLVELWVLTEEAVDQLDALVRDADERLMSRLLFAVATEDGKTTIVLKTRPSKLSPPVLPLDKVLGFKPYWKLPNLFLPAGKRLMPTLRRDAVRKLLADDPAQVVWLMPSADGKFTPEVLPDDAFRPLADWIDYVIDHEHEKIGAWINATRFDFDSFICRDDLPDPPKPPVDKSRKGRKVDRDDVLDKSDKEIGPAKGATKKPASSDAMDLQIAAEIVPPSELKVRLREIEEQFKNFDGPLDDPARAALWPQLARLNAGLKDKSEAAICWTNAFWGEPELAAEDTWNWLHAEDAEGADSTDGRGMGRGPRSEDALARSDPRLRGPRDPCVSDPAGAAVVPEPVAKGPRVSRTPRKRARRAGRLARMVAPGWPRRRGTGRQGRRARSRSIAATAPVRGVEQGARSAVFPARGGGGK